LQTFGFFEVTIFVPDNLAYLASPTEDLQRIGVEYRLYLEI